MTAPLHQAADQGPRQDAGGVAVSAAWIDRFGDVWTFDEDGTGHSFETADFPREHVERKWGPLQLAPDPATPTRAETPADRQESDRG